MNKKLINGILASVLLVLLVGCGGSSSTDAAASVSGSDNGPTDAQVAGHVTASDPIVVPANKKEVTYTGSDNGPVR
jgi:ABC-type glycerol-3-phosphate transport system substrate-binding protein